MPENTKIRRVLILEDEPIISRILQRTFTSAGMETEIANNGLSAKEKLDSGESYDLFTFDIRTPVMSGIQLYEYMEENYPNQLDKVIFMTGDCLDPGTSVFLKRVNRPFLNKPFTYDDIMELANRVLMPESNAA